MKQSFSHKINLAHKEKKVPVGGFFSFFAFLAAVFFLTGCFHWNNEEKKDSFLEERNIRRVKKIEDIRLIRFLLVEKGKYILAERVLSAVAEQLDLQVRVTATLPENVVPLLRSDKADLAFGVVLDSKELARFRLEGYTLRLSDRKAGENTFFFLMPKGSEQLWGILEKAALSAAANRRIDFTLSAEEVMEKSPVAEKQETLKEKMIKEDVSPEKAEKREYIAVKDPSGEGKRSSRGKLKKRERIRAKIRQNLEKMKKLKEEK